MKKFLLGLILVFSTLMGSSQVIEQSVETMKTIKVTFENDSTDKEKPIKYLIVKSRTPFVVYSDNEGIYKNWGRHKINLSRFNKDSMITITPLVIKKFVHYTDQFKIIIK